MNNAENRKKGAFLSVLNMIFSLLIGIVYMPFVLKFLGKSEYGVFSLANSLIAYLAILDLGFGNALVRYSARAKSEGKEVKINSPIDALKYGIGLLPEDRQTQGLINELPIYQNVSSADMSKFIKNGKIDVNEEEKTAIELCQKIQLKAKDISAPPSSLSGGNQQKVVFAKLLNCKLKVLILDEPTKGIDVGAKYSIYEIMNELTASGYAIIMVSSEMPEVLGMADRIVVMRNGRVAGLFDAKGTTQEKILEASLKQDEGEEK